MGRSVARSRYGVAGAGPGSSGAPPWRRWRCCPSPWYTGVWPRRDPEESVVVTAADTQYPGGTMVYHAPEKVAVVWVFDE